MFYKQLYLERVSVGSIVYIRNERLFSAFMETNSAGEPICLSGTPMNST